jgi:hypothetical protein
MVGERDRYNQGYPVPSELLYDIVSDARKSRAFLEQYVGVEGLPRVVTERVRSKDEIVDSIRCTAFAQKQSKE